LEELCLLPASCWFHDCRITEDEIERVTKSLKGKLSTGYDGIPEYLVKQRIKYIKNPLVHIYDASLSSGTFPD
jgi:hypothetical protein